MQPANIIEQIRQGDRHARRNILSERSRKLVTSESPAPPKNKEGASKADSVDIRPVKKSKAHCLQQQVGSIADIAADLNNSVELRERFSSLHEEAIRAQANTSKFQNLQKAREIGLIYESEFLEEAKFLLLD